MGAAALVATPATDDATPAPASTVSKGRAKELSAARWDEELWTAAAKTWGDEDGNIPNVRWQHLVLVQQLFEWIDVERRGSVDLDEFLSAFCLAINGREFEHLSPSLQQKFTDAAIDAGDGIGDRLGKVQIFHFLRRQAENDKGDLGELLRKFAAGMKMVAVTKLFQFLDVDQSGSLDADEFLNTYVQFEYGVRELGHCNPMQRMKLSEDLRASAGAAKSVRLRDVTLDLKSFAKHIDSCSQLGGGLVGPKNQEFGQQNMVAGLQRVASTKRVKAHTDLLFEWLDVDRSGLLEVDEFLPLFVKYATGKELRHLNAKEREEWATDLAHGEDCISRERLDSYLQEEAASYSEDDVARPSDTLAVLAKLLTLRLQQQMRALFERIDVNGDGTLDVDEFLEIYIRYASGESLASLSATELDEWREEFAALDKDADEDCVGFQAFCRFLKDEIDSYGGDSIAAGRLVVSKLASIHLKQQVQELSDHLFKWIDTDGNGFLEAEEFLAPFVRYASGRTLSHLSPSEREQWLEDFAAHPTRGRILSKAKFENYIRDEARSFVDDIDGDSDEDDDADTTTKVRTNANTDSEIEAELIVLRKLNAIMAQVKEKELFDFLDKDGNGQLDVSEFLRVFVRYASGKAFSSLDSEEQKDWMSDFESLDEKNHAHVSFPAFHKYLLSEAETFEGVPKQIVMQVLLNKLTQIAHADEVQALKSKLFDLLDANGDGVLQVSEYLDAFVQYATGKRLQQMSSAEQQEWMSDFHVDPATGKPAPLTRAQFSNHLDEDARSYAEDDEPEDADDFDVADPLGMNAAVSKARATPPREYQMIVLNKLLRVVKQQQQGKSNAVDSKRVEVVNDSKSNDVDDAAAAPGPLSLTLTK